MRKQKEEAEKYTELFDKRKELRRRLYLLRLFQVEKEVASLHAQAAEARAAAEAEVAQHAELDEAHQALMKRREEAAAEAAEADSGDGKSLEVMLREGAR